MPVCACDRCGRDVEVYTRQIEFCNCGRCEEEYQISLWRNDHFDRYGWTEEADTRWQREFEMEYGMTYGQYMRAHKKYREEGVF